MMPAEVAAVEWMPWVDGSVEATSYLQPILGGKHEAGRPWETHGMGNVFSKCEGSETIALSRNHCV